MGGTVTITVDGREVEVTPGRLLLDVLREQGIRVPTLCHDDRLKPYGGCRLCVVERRDGRPGLVTACSTPVQRGMIIETSTPAIDEARRRQLQLLVLDHRMECPTCERTGDCRFQELIYEYGIPEERLPFERRTRPRDEGSAVIIRDPEKCILCGRCVRLCEEVQGVAEIGMVGRGLEARVATLLDSPLDCEFCGQCVNACPVGALVARPHATEVPAWLRTRATTTCSFCSSGCQVEVETWDGRLQNVTADPAAEPNRGKLCARGWLGWDILEHPERLTTPLVRREGRLEEATWEEALERVAEALGAARDGGGAIAGVGTARMTCEDAALFGRLLAGELGAATVEVGPTGGATALAAGMGAAVGAAASTATFEDLREADLVLVLRADPGRTHPLVKTELVQGAVQRGRPFVLAHCLSGGLERHAAVHLCLQPGTDHVLLHGMARLVLDHLDRTPSEGTDGFGAWSEALGAYTPDVIERVTGVVEDDLRELVDRLLGAERPLVVVPTGLGIPGDEARVARAAAELMGLLGWNGAPGGRVLVLGEKANLQGVLASGLGPSLGDGERRHLEETMAAAGLGQVQVLYLVGEDPVGSWPRRFAGRAAVRGARFVVVQDAFATATTRLADVVLPVAILGERRGTVVGADGVPRRLERVLEPPEGLPQDGELLAALAGRLGVDVGDWRTAGAPAATGTDARPVIRFTPPDPPEEMPRHSGMLLDASPQLFHSGLVTAFSERLQELAPTVAARLAPRDGREAGISNGEQVRVAVDGRELLLRARYDRRVRPGTVLVSWSGLEDGAAGVMDHDAAATPAAIRRMS